MYKDRFQYAPPNTRPFGSSKITFFATYDPNFPLITDDQLASLRSGYPLDLPPNTPLAITADLVEFIIKSGGRSLGNEDIYPEVNVRIKERDKRDYIVTSQGFEIRFNPQNRWSPFVLGYAHIQYLHFHYWMQQRARVEHSPPDTSTLR